VVGSDDTGTVHPRVAIIGAGAIGEILAVGLLQAGWEPDRITLVARRAERAGELKSRHPVEVLLDPSQALPGRQVVVVAVKPRDVEALLANLRGRIAPDQVVLSFAAGVPTTLFEQALGEIPVVRAMPNTPAFRNQAITAYAGGSHAKPNDLKVALVVLEAIGEVIPLEEHLLDAVTAVSGTGPAYVYLLAEALTEAAIREGLPRHAAERLIDQTMKGAGSMLSDTTLSPAKLRAQVTSPGGTTAAAVHVLEEGGFRALVEDAVAAAARRSRELGEKRPKP